jgi:hypothetical protein
LSAELVVGLVLFLFAGAISVLWSKCRLLPSPEASSSACCPRSSSPVVWPLSILLVALCFAGIGFSLAATFLIVAAGGGVPNVIKIKR